MPPPRNPPVPRFAPENSITLVSALDTFGRAVDPAWTGEEISADTSDEERAHRVFMAVMQEAAQKPQTQVYDTQAELANALVDDLSIAVRERCDMELAARRRWQAAAIQFMRCLHRAVLRPCAMGSDGKIYAVPSHIWAADGADELFDTGGLLLIRAGEVIVRQGLTYGPNTATILIKEPDLRIVVHRLASGEAAAGLSPASGERPPDPPGPKPGTTANAALFWTVALEILEGPDKPNRGRGRLSALVRLISSDPRTKNLNYRQNSIEKMLRSSLKEWERQNPV